MSISDVLETLKRKEAAVKALPAAVKATPSQSAGWADRLGRETLEPVPAHPGQWREPEASAALCIRCSEPLAEGDLLSCEQHQVDVGVTARPARSAVAVTPGPPSGRHDLLALAELRGWQALAFRPGERIGGSEAMWRSFAETARGKMFRLARAANWERWGETVQQYQPGGRYGGSWGAGGGMTGRSSAPVLPAYDTIRSWRVWCTYCKRWHYHAGEPGHRAAHCHVATSPYRKTGYILELAADR